MAVTGPDEARAIALFNPTASGPGFLQPILMGPGRDNQNYIQIFSDPARIDGFLAISWPDRDFTMLQEEPVVQMGGEPLWAFAFPDGASLTLPWSRFREEMRARIDDGALSAHPLLLFDLVDTLDLDEAKRIVFGRAFEHYAAMGRTMAERWRDRAILEPALASALPPVEIERHDTLARSIGGKERTPRLRARISGDFVLVSLESSSPEIQRGLDEAYRKLAALIPDIFPEDARVISAPPLRRAEVVRSNPAKIIVVLVGRITRGNVDHGDWQYLGVEVIDESHFNPESRSQRSRVTVILGAQSDWQALAEMSRRLRDRPTTIVTLSTSVVPLLRDLEFQERAAAPTIAFFAPFATTTAFGRDPVKPVRALLEIISEDRAANGVELPGLEGLAKNNMLVREPLWSNQNHVEVACRLTARALRAGAVVGGRGRLYVQGSVPDRDHAEWEFALKHMFEMQASRERIRVAGRRATLLLLIERVARYDPGELDHYLKQGTRRLLEMRGWRIVNDNDHGFSIADDQRKFSAMIIGNRRDLPREDPSWQSPGLDNAPLLLIHDHPKREQLLIGNRGPFFHVALEDVALMEPGTMWVWPILRRQLLNSGSKPTLASLRLCAALVLEAIRRGRAQSPIIETPWDLVAETLESDDCERFVDFIESGFKRHRAVLRVRYRDKGSHTLNQEAFIELQIEDEGPVAYSVG